MFKGRISSMYEGRILVRFMIYGRAWFTFERTLLHSLTFVEQNYFLGVNHRGATFFDNDHKGPSPFFEILHSCFKKVFRSMNMR